MHGMKGVLYEGAFMRSKIIFFIIIVFLFLVVLLQNTQVVSVKFLFWEIRMSRIIFFPLTLLIGMVIGFFIGRKSWEW